MFETVVGPLLLSFGLARSVAPIDAEARVRLALACETRGDRAERDHHLARAVALDPDNARARALLGQVRDGSAWIRPEAVRAHLDEDAELAEKLAEYNARRARTPDTAAGQWGLALWCEQRGLDAEATAHFTAVTRLAPRDESAWKRLGYVRYRGRWMTREQIDNDRAEAGAQSVADRAWHPKLTRWRAWLGQKDRKAEAVENLDTIDDPRAVPSVWLVFAGREPSEQAWAVRLLGQIEAPAASRGLALLSVVASSDRVRDGAIDRLVPRDPRPFVGLLIRFLGQPFPYEVESVGGPGDPGILEIEGARVIQRRIYDPPAIQTREGLAITPAQAEDVRAPLSSASRASNRRAGLSVVPLFRGSWLRTEREVFSPLGEIERETRRSTEAMSEQLAEDVETLDRVNGRIALTNARARRVLFATTGQDLGDDRRAWLAWWTDQQGYSYTSSQQQPKPTVVVNVQPTYVPPPVTIRPAAVSPGMHHSCFGAGTAVHTRNGLRAIEGLRVGDLVLTQDTEAGGLSYQPVVAVYHNKPSATVRLDLGDTAIVATGIHRFWRAGEGWAMARDLEPGDRLRTLGGAQGIRSVREDQNQPVYNLEVARNRSYFVGRRGLLVHDNTLVEPTPHPFDAAP